VCGRFGEASFTAKIGDVCKRQIQISRGGLQPETVSCRNSRVPWMLCELSTLSLSFSHAFLTAPPSFDLG